MSTAVAILHKEQIIQRVAKGDRLLDISADLGVTPAAISQQLAKDPEYEAAMAAGLEAKMDQREMELECADDGLKVARARELLSHARWRAERRLPHLYGQQRPAIAVQTEGPAKIMVVSYADPQTPSD